MDGLWILLDGSNLWMYLITVLVAMMNLIYGYWSMDLYLVLSLQMGMLANMSHQKKEIGSTCYVVIMFFSHMLLIYGMGLNWTNTLWHRYFRNQPWFCFNSKEDRIGRIEFGKVSTTMFFSSSTTKDYSLWSEPAWGSSQKLEVIAALLLIFDRVLFDI